MSSPCVAAPLVGRSEPDHLGRDAQPPQRFGALGVPAGAQLVGADAGRPGVRGLAIGDGDDDDVTGEASGASARRR